ncbi:MAG: potassium channel family protein, partial [Verrucomicrobiota bacterium]
HVGPFQVALLFLSLFALAAIATDTLFSLPHEISRILQAVDLIACGVFFVDFVVRFRAAESKLAFMKFGWLDLIACVPTIEAFRLGRFAAVLRVLRLLRGVRSLQRLVEMMFTNKTRGGVASVATSMFLLVVLASIAILLCEKDPASNIKTADDAIWWSVTTVTTVGYGDRYPVTEVGRFVAMALMVAGVGLFGGLSGIIASKFLGSKPPDDGPVLAELRQLRAEVESLKARRDD